MKQRESRGDSLGWGRHVALNFLKFHQIFSNFIKYDGFGCYSRRIFKHRCQIQESERPFSHLLRALSAPPLVSYSSRGGFPPPARIRQTRRTTERRGVKLALSKY
jgi:hypothetical protein